MKKLILLLAMCCCFSSCTAILIGAVVDSATTPRFSFDADGHTFKATNDNLGIFRIIETADYGFAIAYRGSSWDVSNHFDKAELGLNCGFFTGTLKEDKEYVFTQDDALDTYPIFKYSELEVEDATDLLSITRAKTFWFNATDGWFKITKINEDDGTISGRFAFTAVCDDPDSDEVVEITGGVFKNIPYLVVVE